LISSFDHPQIINNLNSTDQHKTGPRPSSSQKHASGQSPELSVYHSISIEVYVSHSEIFNQSNCHSLFQVRQLHELH
jgi:hypothetical protein